MFSNMKHKDEIRDLIAQLPEPTPEQLAELDERGDPKAWGIAEALERIQEKANKD